MKPSDRHPMRWVGQTVFKMEVDCNRREVQIRGKIMNYCPSSARYLLMYADGSSDGVPIDEIEDHVPMQLQLPNKRPRSSWGAAAQSKEPAECRRPPKRSKMSVSKSKSSVTDNQAVVSRFVRTILCELTRVLDVSDDKRQTLSNILDSGKDRPLAALALYDQEGGLDALDETLRACTICGDNTHDEAAKENLVKSESFRRQESSETSLSSPCSRSPCGQHFRELLQGNGDRSTHRRIQTDSHPEKALEVVDLTGDGTNEEEGEEMDDTASASKHIHFGDNSNSTVHFDERDSVKIFRLQLKRAGFKLRNLPKQNPEEWKSVLKV
ncbi:hypothetical protein F444_01016 [Phytophthora nicotianae P1976]|uniref:Uncharacterized protein n=1 Tax=Phytophthora nicotianae P1976 TaxID=1317066 RepID=A0A081B2C9_PHYNI|nr:hypothetical protein F444_01016 [Phytophthora nicotianae P1976]